MKLKEYNADNSKTLSNGSPRVSVVRKSGTTSFSKSAVELLGIKDQSSVIIANDEDAPRDWYISISKNPSAFKIRLKNGISNAMFNCSKVACKLLDTAKEFKSGSFRISKEPTVLNGVSYFLIITAKSV